MGTNDGGNEVIRGNSVKRGGKRKRVTRGEMGKSVMNEGKCGN